jgi:hypothetical protein
LVKIIILFDQLYMPWLLLSFWFTRCFFGFFALCSVLCIPVCGGDPYGSFQVKDETAGPTGFQSWMSRLVTLSKDITYHCAIKSDHLGADFSSLSSDPCLGPASQAFYDASGLNTKLFPSVLEIGARYDRAQCYISLAAGRPTETGLFKDFSPTSQLSMGIGLRYDWSDTIALQLAATLHYVGSPTSDSAPERDDMTWDSSTYSANQPMSDLNDQVNGLSSASGGSFAEGLFTIVYYFCK